MAKLPLVLLLTVAAAIPTDHFGTRPLRIGDQTFAVHAGEPEFPAALVRPLTHEALVTTMKDGATPVSQSAWHYDTPGKHVTGVLVLRYAKSDDVDAVITSLRHKEKAVTFGDTKHQVPGTMPERRTMQMMSPMRWVSLAVMERPSGGILYETFRITEQHTFPIPSGMMATNRDQYILVMPDAERKLIAIYISAHSGGGPWGFEKNSPERKNKGFVYEMMKANE